MQADEAAFLLLRGPTVVALLFFMGDMVAGSSLWGCADAELLGVALPLSRCETST